MATPLEECLTGLTGSSTRAGTSCTDLQLKDIAEWPTTRHGPDHVVLRILALLSLVYVILQLRVAFEILQGKYRGNI